MVRDNFQSRHISTKVDQLHIEDPRQVHFVEWSDAAALANRRDLSLTGSYAMAATTPAMMQGHQGPLTFISRRSSKLP